VRTEEGVACEGTALESRTIRTGNKAFLFLRPTDARLKLAGSLKEAAAHAAEAPNRYVVGTGGWILVKFDDATDPTGVVERWIVESHALLGAGKPAKRATKRAVAKPRLTAKKRK
jgi:hypothetical protein